MTPVERAARVILDGFYHDDTAADMGRRIRNYLTKGDENDE